jgi:hypothetical protein
VRFFVKKANWLFSLAFVVVPMLMGCNQPPASKPSTAPAGGNTIGVPECDDYLSKVEACIANNVPEDARAMQRQSMDQMRDQWRQAAANPTAKAGLAAGCKAALDAARSSFATYGCEW